MRFDRYGDHPLARVGSVLKLSSGVEIDCEDDRDGLLGLRIWREPVPRSSVPLRTCNGSLEGREEGLRGRVESDAEASFSTSRKR
jgi:hypothetical protein